MIVWVKYFCDYGGTKIVLKLVGWRIFCLLLESGLDSPLAIGYMHKNLQGRVALAKIESLWMQFAQAKDLCMRHCKGLVFQCFIFCMQFESKNNFYSIG